ncbi:hypothetical protein QE363_003596 [Sphingomonas sp. SORGH_AS870]|nr:hypothetical protein [Sphingomonas sp. SORGH_AS_0870]
MPKYLATCFIGSVPPICGGVKAGMKAGQAFSAARRALDSFIATGINRAWPSL